MSSWEVVAKDIDPANYYGVTSANGMVGLVSSPAPMKVKDVVLNGVYDYYQRGHVSNILKVFNHVNMDLDIDGRRVTPENIQGFAQTLDMKEGKLVTTFELAGKARVKHEMMALRHLPYTSLVLLEIEALDDIRITPISEIYAPDHLQQPRNFFSHIDRPHVKIPLLTSTAKSPSGRYDVAASNSFIFEEEHGEEPELVHEDWDFNRHLVKFDKELSSGQTYRFAVVASSITSEHVEHAKREAERLSIYAKLEGVDRLLKRHRSAWNKLWESDIIIEGNPGDQRDVRFALYHLYAFAREGTAYSLSPMGLSGLGYNGHVFWDTEIWMYPPLLLLQPEIARSLLEYRFERLGAAQNNAFAHGYKGAMYPWESAGTGDEDTPPWALTGPFQHHISADIGWAFWKYYQVTGDKTFLRTRAWPVLKAVAEFWVSRVEREGEDDYHIRNVIGANEWEENIDDNAFTNGMAIVVLRYAAEAARALGLEPDLDWEHLADNIPILKFDNGVTRENATYDGVNIKQADVNLLAFPIGLITDETQIRKDLEYYEPRMDPGGPAMGFSVLCALYAKLGEAEKTYALFKKSYKPNEVPPFGVLAETAGGTNPYFATGAGGMLQAVLMALSGLEITDKGIVQNGGFLPDQWSSMTITGVGVKEESFRVERN